jgi:hypothetical protein
MSVSDVIAWAGEMGMETVMAMAMGKARALLRVSGLRLPSPSGREAWTSGLVGEIWCVVGTAFGYLRRLCLCLCLRRLLRLLLFLLMRWSLDELVTPSVWRVALALPHF